MEEQATTIETTIVETDKFHGNASLGDHVHLYRRLEDRYDSTAIAMINDQNEVVGYLNRKIASDTILPYLKQGLRFQCIVSGKSDEEGDLPIEIHPRLSEWHMSREAETIASVSGVGPVSEAYFKSIGIDTDEKLIQRVEASSVQSIGSEIRQQDSKARLSVSQIEKIYEHAKVKYTLT
jgi:hypothetical protein